jgi:hypothetical protein
MVGGRQGLAASIGFDEVARAELENFFGHLSLVDGVARAQRALLIPSAEAPKAWLSRSWRR